MLPGADQSRGKEISFLLWVTIFTWVRIYHIYLALIILYADVTNQPYRETRAMSWALENEIKFIQRERHKWVGNYVWLGYNAPRWIRISIYKRKTNCDSKAKGGPASRPPHVIKHSWPNKARLLFLSCRMIYRHVFVCKESQKCSTKLILFQTNSESRDFTRKHFPTTHNSKGSKK